MDQVIFIVGSLLCIVGCPAASPASPHQIAVAQAPSSRCDNQNGPWTLPNVPWWGGTINHQLRTTAVEGQIVRQIFLPDFFFLIPGVSFSLILCIFNCCTQRKLSSRYILFQAVKMETTHFWLLTKLLVVLSYPILHTSTQKNQSWTPSV